MQKFKKSQSDDPIKATSDPIKVISDPIKQKLYQAVSQNGTLNYTEYAAQIGVSEATVKRRLGELKHDGMIIRVGSNKTGYWEIVDADEARIKRILLDNIDNKKTSRR